MSRQSVLQEIYISLLTSYCNLVELNLSQSILRTSSKSLLRWVVWRFFHYRALQMNFVSMYSVVLYYIVRKYWKNWLNWPLQESTFHCIFNNHIFSFGVFRLDQLLYQAINLDNGLSNSTDLSEASEWDVAITEIRAQLYMLSGHLLLRMANEVCCFVCLCNVSKIFPSRFLSPECSSNYSTVTIEFVYLSMWLWSPSGSIIKEITPAFLSQFLHDEKCALTNSRSLKL